MARQLRSSVLSTSGTTDVTDLVTQPALRKLGRARFHAPRASHPELPSLLTLPSCQRQVMDVIKLAYGGMRNRCSRSSCRFTAVILLVKYTKRILRLPVTTALRPWPSKVQRLSSHAAVICLQELHELHETKGPTLTSRASLARISVDVHSVHSARGEG